MTTKERIRLCGGDRKSLGRKNRVDFRPIIRLHLDIDTKYGGNLVPPQTLGQQNKRHYV